MANDVPLDKKCAKVIKKSIWASRKNEKGGRDWDNLENKYVEIYYETK